MRSWPPILVVESTNCCNLHCIQCLRTNAALAQRGFMSFDSFRKIIEQFPYLMSVQFSGFGEPFMNKELFEMVSFVRKTRRHCLTQVFTNGSLLDEDIACRIITSGLSMVNISLDAISPSSYQAIRKGGDFNRIVENIKRLLVLKRKYRSRTPEVRLDFCLMDENLHERGKFLEFARSLGILPEEVNTIRGVSSKWGYHSCLGTERIHVADGCYSFWEIVQISWDGYWVLCCWEPRPEIINFGNILEVPFRLLWNSQYVQDVRRKLYNKQFMSLPCDECCYYKFKEDVKRKI
ncbi:MAG: radical SAM protein [Candidatus Omnitrophota bacterium]